MDMMLWNIGLTAALGLMSWLARTMWNEQQRLSVLLNKTREELAKSYQTRSDAHADINRVVARLDQLDAKIDRLIDRLIESKK